VLRSAVARRCARSRTIADPGEEQAHRLSISYRGTRPRRRMLSRSVMASSIVGRPGIERRSRRCRVPVNRHASTARSLRPGQIPLPIPSIAYALAAIRNPPPAGLAKTD
jgi:hypothetical protein